MGISNTYEIFEFGETLRGSDILYNLSLLQFDIARVSNRKFEASTGVFYDSLYGRIERLTQDEYELFNLNNQLSDTTILFCGPEKLYVTNVYNGRFLKNGFKTSFSDSKLYDGIAVLPYSTIGKPKYSNYSAILKALNDKLAKDVVIKKQFSHPIGQELAIQQQKS